MQVQHKAVTTVPAYHPAVEPHHGLGDWFGLLGAIVVIFGFPLVALFVAYRAFRWFVRATR